MTFAAEYATKRPGETAVRDARTALSWVEVDDLLRRSVHVLHGLDLDPARRIAVLAENSVETLLAYAAATLAGLSAVPVNFHLTAREVAYQLTDSAAGAVLVDGKTAAVGRDAADLAGVSSVLGWHAAAQTPGVRDWAELLAGAPEGEPATDRPPLPTLVYTSGTTGLPKGVELPPTSFVGGNDVVEHVRRLGDNAMLEHGRHLIVGPMYHSGPLAGTRLFLGGAPITVLGRFDAEAVLAAIDRDRIGSAIMVPTHFRRILTLPAKVRAGYDVSSLRYVLQVGAKCPDRVKKAMIDWWGPIVWESYGATEVGTTCLASAEEWLARPGTVGRPVPPFEAFVLDGQLKPAPPGVEGRLYFRDRTGRGIVYHQRGTESAGLGPGVFTLGEIGYLDADGYVYVTDRFSDMVVSGGVNIYPAEAEQVLAEHPGVADVACVGVPDQDMGERLRAFVVPVSGVEPSRAELHEYCRAQLAHYKCPREIELVPALRRTAMGKVDKRALRHLAADAEGSG